MSSNEWLPAHSPFDVVRRGYDPQQVTSHFEQLEYDLRIATANSEATNQRVSELTDQLSSVQAEADSLRAQLDRLALEPVSMSGLSDRMQRMIRLADEEATEIRARANADADQMRAALQAALAQAADDREAFDSERERTRRQLAEQVQTLVGDAQRDADQTRGAARAEAEASVQAARAEADTTLGAARASAEQTTTTAQRDAMQMTTTAQAAAEQALSAAQAEAVETLGSARAEAHETLTSARSAAEQLTAHATAERQRLDAEGHAHRTQVQDDFEIAMSARRSEAHQRLTEREALSVAEADQRVAEATSTAERLVAEATATSAELVRRAAAESHQRVSDADDAVQALTALRTRLHEQLAELRRHLGQVDELAASAPGLLTPPDDEAGRPRAEDFPVDPAGRPTPVPGQPHAPEVEQIQIQPDQAELTQDEPSEAQPDAGARAGHEGTRHDATTRSLHPVSG